MPRVIPPVRGASNATAFIDQPGDTAPPGTVLNFRAEDIATDRPRGGQRPPLEKAFDQQLGDGPVQALASVTRASAVTGYILGEASDMPGATALDQDTLVGQVWGLDRVPSMEWQHYMDVTGLTPAGPATNSVSAIAIHPSGNYIAIASNYTRGAVTAYTIQVLNASTRAVISTVHGYTVGVNRFCNTLHYGTSHLFACAVNANGVACVAQYAVSSSDGSLTLVSQGTAAASAHTLHLWASEAIECGTYTSAGVEYLIVAFNGASTAGTIVDAGGTFGSTTLTAGLYAQHVRSGLMKFRVNALGLQIVDYGTGLDASADGYESAHHYWRVFEHPYPPQVPSLQSRRFGCLINALDVKSDGSVVFCRTNQGYGPNASFLPNNVVPPRTVMRITPGGVLDWEIDPQFLYEQGDNGFNDLTYAGDPTPSPALSACRFTADGDVFVGGRNSGEGCVFLLDRDTGTEIWRQNVVASGTGAQSVRQASMAIDPTDGNVIVGFDRNSSRHLAKLNRENGDVIWTFDLNQSGKSGLAVGVLPTGKVVYCTEKCG